VDGTNIQVEGAFGVLKEDFGFRRFLTRGKVKTETQFFILAIAFNVQKLWNREKFKRFNMFFSTKKLLSSIRKLNKQKARMAIQTTLCLVIHFLNVF